MAMTWEQMAVNTAVARKDVQSFVSAGVREDWFEDEDQRRAWEFLISQWQEYGEPCDKQMFLANFPDYDYTRPSYATQAVIDLARKTRERVVVTRGLAEASIALNEDRVADALDVMVTTHVEALRETHHNANTDLVDNTDERLAYYQKIAETPEAVGIPTGFPSIDALIGGLRPKQFVVLTAQPKVGKSIFSLAMAMKAHDLGKNVLYITYEMTEQEQWMRHDAMLAHVDSNRLQTGTMTPTERHRVEEALQVFALRESRFDVINDPELNTISAVRAKIEEHDADLCVIDGMYFMHAEGFALKDQGSPQAYTAISRGLKRLAQKTDIPLIGTTQTLAAKTRNNRIDLASPGYSSAWGQDADLMIGVERLDDDDDSRRVLRIVGGRNTGGLDVMVSTDWQEMRFEEVDDGLGPDDAQAAAERGRPDRS